jgi:hypothetical protein
MAFIGDIIIMADGIREPLEHPGTFRTIPGSKGCPMAGCLVYTLGLIVKGLILDGGYTLYFEPTKTMKEEQDVE